jgi:FMN-dependent NADH-azoreductase
MSTVLVVTSSVLAEHSVSGDLVKDVVDGLRRHDPSTRLVVRDLGANPVPHLTTDAVTAIRDEPSNEAQARARALSDEHIAEVQAADILVMGVPMYNFGIPSTLKAWFDHVLRSGTTFRYTEAGVEGLVKGKRAILVLAKGGYYSDGPMQAMDSQEPHVRGMLNFIGVTDIHYIRAEKLALGPDEREKSIIAAKAAIGELMIDDSLIPA